MKIAVCSHTLKYQRRRGSTFIIAKLFLHNRLANSNFSFPLSIFMSPVLIIIAFLLLYYTAAKNTSDGHSTGQNIYEFCPATRCSADGPDIRFPFRLNTQPTFCGLDGFELSCSNNMTLLHLPFSGDYYVQNIDYKSSEVVIEHAHETACTLQSLLSPNLTNPRFYFSYSDISHISVIVKCTDKNISQSLSAIGPIDCINSDDRFFFYLVEAYYSMDELPPSCSIYRRVYPSASTSGYLPDGIHIPLTTLNIYLAWKTLDGCSHCEISGKYCGFNFTSHSTICCNPQNSTICFNIHHSHVPTVTILVSTAASIGGIIFFALLILLVYKSRESENEKETQVKVEKFLEDYRTLNPTRYTYNDLKRITHKFKHRLGQGGYGSVFKGKLSNGVPVAIKMLEHSIRNGEEFINEVATIGRIHHFNIVRLLGFYSEGTRRALIYEFMPNGSLEKFLFSKKDKSTRLLSWEKLWKIAIGVARGIEYLHQGCNQRIVHFDIKPHNILLDYNFQPKISDFGLAKLCSKEQSIVSMTAARGTAGYIAPELFSKNFGEVSYKSDVFSYGMMLLEMVGCRKNIDATIENESQIFFPEWIYNKMSQGEGLGFEVEAEEDEEIAKKLAIVGLWCIQWNPTERPSTPMVIQMLEGDLQSLEMPPKPFVSSENQLSAN